jgi:hypothetical protein
LRDGGSDREFGAFICELQTVEAGTGDAAGSNQLGVTARFADAVVVDPYG